MRVISDRISIDETKNFSLVILGKVEKWKESLLFFWVLAWSFCGSVFLFYYISENPLQYSLPLLIMLAFWFYFEVRILKVFLWRRNGFEHIQFSEKEVLIKNNLFGRGKRKAYGFEHIEIFIENEYSPKNFFSFLDQSFWVIGGQRIYFSYLGKSVVLGMQLEEGEVKKLLSILNGQLKRMKRELRAKSRKLEDQ